MEDFEIVSYPNCLCKLRYFTIYLRKLILERSEWHIRQKEKWPLLHDFIGITLLSCLKNENFQFVKRNGFSWSKYDDEVCLTDFRLVNGKILICTRLKGFPSFINIFIVDCNDGEIRLTGQVHNYAKYEHLDCYEIRYEAKIPVSIHFSPCGGYFRGQRVYLQYDIPRLLTSIISVLEAIKLHLKRNTKYKNLFQYITCLPMIISDKFFSDNDSIDEKEVDELIAGKFRFRHTNPEKIMFLSPEMIEAQKNSGVILYHYRDNEIKASFNRPVNNYSPIKRRNFSTMSQYSLLNDEYVLNRRVSDQVLSNINILKRNRNHYFLEYIGEF